MRGIPAARFQEANIAVLETEVRYNLDERWAVVGFLGTGRAWGNRVSYDDADTPVSGGLGFRYLIARRLGLYAGIDVAKSTVDQAFYIQVGNGWR
jgi:hemolysin activation/secretion protein